MWQNNNSNNNNRETGKQRESQHVLCWVVVVWLEFVSLVSCILPPLCQFCAATNHQELRIQTRHIRSWLTYIKFWCKVDVHWSNKLFWPIRTGHILQPQKGLEICKCQRTVTPHLCFMIGFAGNELAFVHVTIFILSGNSVFVFWEIWLYIHTAGWLLYLYVQIRTGMQVFPCHDWQLCHSQPELT